MSTEKKPLKQIIKDSEDYLRKKVKWYNKKKKNSTGPDVWLAYVDARALEDYLDETLGPENWQNRFTEVKGYLFCELGIFWDGVWIWKGNNGSESAIEAEKGAASDAFKRACFKWGFGRFLYDDERKPRKGKSFIPPKVEKPDPEAATKEVVIKNIEGYQEKLPAEYEQMLNYISSLGHDNLDDTPLNTLNTIQKRFEEVEKSKTADITKGFTSKK